MESSLLLFCLMGGLVYADTDAVGQVMLSQPLIACPVAGLILGNVAAGLTVGIILQLPYVVEIPAGGSRVSLGNMGAFVAAGIAIKLMNVYSEQANIILTISILFGILLSRLTIPIQHGLRQVNYLLLKQADIAAEAGDVNKINRLNYAGAMMTFFFGIVYTALFFVIGKFICPLIVNSLPSQLEVGMRLLKPALLGAGIGAMYWLYFKKSSMNVMLLGILFGAIIILVKFVSG